MIPLNFIVRRCRQSFWIGLLTTILFFHPSPFILPPSSFILYSSPLIFSTSPTDEEIFRAHLFEEPVVPMGHAFDVQGSTFDKNTNSKAQNLESETRNQKLETENQVLAKALMAYSQRKNNDDVSAITQFLSSHPDSRWRGSLLTNLGMVYRWTGYFSKALESWEEAWKLGKKETDPKIQAITNRAVAELAELNARLGRYDRLGSLFPELEGRQILGSAYEKISCAKEGLWMMQNKPGESFLCGPMALYRIRAFHGEKEALNLKIQETQSTLKGTSLTQILHLANELGMNYQMARRRPGSRVIIPSVVHWKVGHYAALVKEENDRYLVQDPTFKYNIWVSKAALDAEASGYFLIPVGSLSAGWQSVMEEEGQTIWGKGNSGVGSSDYITPDQTKCKEDPCPRGMPHYNFHAMALSLNVEDTPLGYTPPLGPPIDFTITYNQREASQPSVFNYSNLGYFWTFNWLSYLIDDPNSPSSDVRLYVKGGGIETYTGFDATNQSYLPQIDSRVVLTRISPTSYTRFLLDGSSEVFSRPDGTTSFPRKVFLTKIIDPQGNAVTLTYDSNLRLTTITDTLGQATTLSYFPNGDIYKITKVTDPFGRSAIFIYDILARLSQITDVMGMQSSIFYNDYDGNFLTTLITPYGQTTFGHGENGVMRWLEAIDPLGNKERAEFEGFEVSGFPQSEPEPPSQLIQTFLVLDARNSYFWDKKAMQITPRDYTKAKVFHWFHAPGGVVSHIMESEKEPLENRIWYEYPGQNGPGVEAGITIGRPSKVARVMDDGSTQLYQLEYNALGKVTKATDPVGRATTHIYDTNQIDLLEIHQTTGTQDDLLAQFSYNTQHLPLTAVDASSQTIAFTYNPQGQVKTLTNPKQEITTLSYDSNGYLTGLTANSSLLISFTYDNLGRVRTATDSENYTITTDYDALDRPTKFTYPDGTFEAITYNRLDLETTRDRLGRVTRRFYNALRQLVAIQDALNRVTQFEWCGCGTLEKITDPLGHVTTWIRDLQGRVTDKVYPNRSTFHYTYETSTSRLKSILDPKNQTTSYNYFLDGNLQQASYSNAAIPTSPVSFTYDPNYNRIATMMDSGNPPGQGDGTGTTTYAYNPITTSPTLGAGRLSGIDGPLSNDVMLYSYDELGRVINRTINGISSGVNYDSLGRVTSANNILGTFLYNYLNATARLTSMGYPNGQKTTFSYFDNLGDQRLKKILHQDPSSSTLLKFDYEYNVEGEITRWSQANDVQVPRTYEFQYDPVDQLLSAKLSTFNLQPSTLKTFVFSYDHAGNRTSEQIDHSVTKANFNNLNELVSQQAGGPMQFKGHLNKPSKVTISNGTTTVPAIVDANNVFQGSVDVVPGNNTVTIIATDYSGNNNTSTNRYQIAVAPSATRSLSYDANGNLTNDGKYKYDWDAVNRLVAINEIGGTHRTEFTYDGLGRMVRLVEKDGATITRDSHFVRIGTELVEERDANGNVIKRFFAQGFEIVSGPNAGKYFYIRDHLGSIREVIDSNGNVVARYDYDLWGKRTLVSGTNLADFGFTGYYHYQPAWMPNAHLLAMYRVYRPDLGRWLSRDPIGILGGMNPYSYVQNRSLRYIDPLGLDDADALLGEENNAAINRGTAGSLIDPNEAKKAGDQVADLGKEVAIAAATSAVPVEGILARFGGWAKRLLGFGKAECNAAEGEMVNVIHFTDQAGVNAVRNSGALRVGTYVTLPGEVSGLNAAGVESALEIQAGRGAFSTTVQVPGANLAVPANGVLTSGQKIQFKLTQPVTPGPFVPTPPN